ncbi:[NiFe]-hydrogenase assembly chaperone HybE [Methylomonas sp. AM2-LC]|uniref:[NiFe]-hydrogenase assembly chaperone HybE n=1 Tax=Methylomonas sp. AM2-LC TaxID=3153301 RepID=UPI003266C015
MLWQNGEHIRLVLEQTFNYILTSRMQDLPLLNSVLRVQAVGFMRVNQDWLGILITPWFMNLLLMPGADNAGITQLPGSKFERAFPYGSFEFTVAHEAQLGNYGVCSLFSPMFEFENQAAAFTAAQSALQNLLANPSPRAISRRDLLRGNLGGP